MCLITVELIWAHLSAKYWNWVQFSSKSCKWVQLSAKYFYWVQLSSKSVIECSWVQYISIECKILHWVQNIPIEYQKILATIVIFMSSFGDKTKTSQDSAWASAYLLFLLCLAQLQSHFCDAEALLSAFLQCL